jgi:hypothetical protein
MPMNIPIPMPMNPPHLVGGMGPPVPPPAPQHMAAQGPPLQMPPIPQGPPPLPPLVNPSGSQNQPAVPPPTLPSLPSPPQQSQPTLPPLIDPPQQSQPTLPPLSSPPQQSQSSPPKQSQPPVPMQVPNVPLVPYGHPVAASMVPETIAVRPPPAIISPPVGVVPLLPSWFVIVSLVLILAIIAEVDSMSKHFGNVSAQYAGPGGGTISQKAIGLVAIAGGAGLLYYMSYYPSIEQFLIAALWR